MRDSASMDDRDKLKNRWYEIENILTLIEECHVVPGDPAGLEERLLSEQRVIEVTLRTP